MIYKFEKEDNQFILLNKQKQYNNHSLILSIRALIMIKEDEMIN